MKLTKFKVGLSLTVILSVLIFSATGFAVPEYLEDSNTWVIDEQAEFNQLVGMKLSAVDFDGDGKPDIKSGDTIALDPDSTTFTQKASIKIDLQNITFMGKDGTQVVLIQDLDGGEYGNYDEVHTGYDGSAPIDSDVSSSLVIKEEGAHVKNLVFEPAEFTVADGVTVDSNNAILVDATDFCSCGGRPMVFENLQMPECGCCLDYDYGIRFTGMVEDWGGRDTNYDSIEFNDVRVQGVSRNAIEFAGSVGNLSDLTFTKLYLGNSGTCGECQVDPGDQGYGLFFNNFGKLESVTLEDSNGLEPGPLKDSEYGIENNTDGIRINGDNVSKVEGLMIENLDIKNHCDNGISIVGQWDPCADDIEGFENSVIDLIDMSIKDSEISNNGDELGEYEEGDGHFDGGYGIFVGQISSACPDSDEPPMPPPLVADTDGTGDMAISYSSAKLNDVILDNLAVFDNTSGGAGLFATKVDGNSSSPALKVLNSRFNEKEGMGDNDQAFGITVATWEGTNGVEISNSTFNDHDGHGTDGITVKGLPVQFLGDGIALLASYEDVYSDFVDNVTIKNTSAKNNGFLSEEGGYGSGLRIEADTIDSIDITGQGSFSENEYHGMLTFAQSGVSNVSVDGDTDEDGKGEIISNSNNGYGLIVATDDGDLKGIDVKDGVFGTEANGNLTGGIRVTTLNGGTIGTSDSAGAVSFDNVLANDNRGHGLMINSAESFLNPSSNIVVNDSEFNENHEDGLHVEAAGDIENPRIEISTFNGNNLGSAGIYIRADGNVAGSSGRREIQGNVVANNTKGIAIYSSRDPKEDEFIDRIVDIAVTDNTTVPNSDDYESGNSDTNIELAAKVLTAVSVENNRIIGSSETGLRLKSVDTSSSLLVQQNIFDTGAEGACVGEGTAIELDALKAEINRNRFKKYDIGIQVLQENSNDSDESAEDTSNHINQNNMLQCCRTIDVSSLDSNKKVDVTDNYWGEDMSADDIKVNVLPKDDPNDQIFLQPIRSEKVDLGLGAITITLDLVTTDPVKDESVDIDYEIANNTGTETTVDAVLTVTDPEDETETILDDSFTIRGDSEETGTATFTPDQDGTFTAKMSVDDGDYTESLDIQVGSGVEPEDKEPYWGEKADPATSGILPAPIDGDEEPYLKLQNNAEPPQSVENNVDVKTVRVYDRTGKMLVEITSGFSSMTQLESLSDDLYYYTVEYTVDGGDTKTSPPMKFVVDKS